MVPILSDLLTKDGSIVIEIGNAWASDDPATSQRTGHDRRIAVYLCYLYRANFIPPDDLKVTFRASEKVCQIVNVDIKSNIGYLTLTLEQAAQWWELFWSVYEAETYFI